MLKEGTDVEQVKQTLLNMPNAQKRRVQLCIHKQYLIVALNNYSTLIEGKLEKEDILLIAGSKLENCELIRVSIYYPTLDSETQKKIDTIFYNQKNMKSHLAADKAHLSPPMEAKLTANPDPELEKQLEEEYDKLLHRRLELVMEGTPQPGYGEVIYTAKRNNILINTSYLQTSEIAKVSIEEQPRENISPPPSLLNWHCC